VSLGDIGNESECEFLLDFFEVGVDERKALVLVEVLVVGAVREVEGGLGGHVHGAGAREVGDHVLVLELPLLREEVLVLLVVQPVVRVYRLLRLLLHRQLLHLDPRLEHLQTLLNQVDLSITKT